MRTAKMLGLAAVAALVAMAFVGAGSASATVLCEEAQADCAANHTYPAGTSIYATSGEVRFSEGGTTTVVCGESELEFTTQAQEGSPLPLEETEATFGKCTAPRTFGISCTVTVSKLGQSSIKWTGSPGANDGTLSFGFPSMVIICGNGGFYRCTVASGNQVPFALHSTDEETETLPSFSATNQGPLTLDHELTEDCVHNIGTKPSVSATYTVQYTPNPLFVAAK